MGNKNGVCEFDLFKNELKRIAKIKKRNPRTFDLDVVKSTVSEIRYNFKTRHGELLLPLDSFPCNQSIERFIAIDNKVMSAFLYVGETLDMVFIRKEESKRKKNPTVKDFIVWFPSGGMVFFRDAINGLIKFKIETKDYDAWL